MLCSAILGAEVFVRGGQRAIRDFVRMLATGCCLLVVYLALIVWMDDCSVVVRIAAGVVWWVAYRVVEVAAVKVLWLIVSWIPRMAA